MDAHTLARMLDAELKPALFKDYCPNGLQVENRRDITFLLCGVTANEALIASAIEKQAQAVLVHHGLFWRGDDGRLTGYRYERIRQLIAHDIALLAYHLPLDAHPIMGNNAQLALRCGWMVDGVSASEPLLMHGKVPTAQPLAQVASGLALALEREPLVIGARDRLIHRIAWCTGAGQGLFEQAIALGVDAFVSGEISEQYVHIARETGVAFLAAGHHATERYGVQALGRWVADETSLRVEFVDIPSPV